MVKKLFFYKFILFTLAVMQSSAYAGDFQKIVKHATYIGMAEIVEYREHYLDVELLEGPRAGQVEIKFGGVKWLAAGNAVDQSLTRKITSRGERENSSPVLSHWPVKGSRPFVILGKNNQLFYFGREVEDQKVEFWTPNYRSNRVGGRQPTNCPDSTGESILGEGRPFFERCLVNLSRFAEYRADIKKRLANKEKDEKKAVSPPRREATEEEKKQAAQAWMDAVKNAKGSESQDNGLDEEKVEAVKSWVKENLDKKKEE